MIKNLGKFAHARKSPSPKPQLGPLDTYSPVQMQDPKTGIPQDNPIVSGNQTATPGTLIQPIISSRTLGQKVTASKPAVKPVNKKPKTSGKKVAAPTKLPFFGV